MTENEFLLEDRVSKIKSVVEKYGEENFYMSFSGGKDSTVLSALVDVALPNNQIPRVYADTGIELKMIRDFVMEKQKKDSRIFIIKPSVPIKPMLEAEGYPFKSKAHSNYVKKYQRAGFNYKSVRAYTQMENTMSGRPIRISCPKKLMYQFSEENKLKISDMCCYNLKEKPLDDYMKSSGKKYAITGIMRSEGGRRSAAQCLAFHGGKLLQFHPLAVLSKEWEDWFIEEYKVEICDIYKPPYNFVRTGCKGCPFALHLQEELDTLEKYFPGERKQCELIWKPVYDEYRRLGYRLKKSDVNKQCELSDFLKGE